MRDATSVMIFVDTTTQMSDISIITRANLESTKKCIRTLSGISICQLNILRSGKIETKEKPELLSIT